MLKISPRQEADTQQVSGLPLPILKVIAGVLRDELNEVNLNMQLAARMYDDTFIPAMHQDYINLRNTRSKLMQTYTHVRIEMRRREDSTMKTEKQITPFDVMGASEQILIIKDDKTGKIDIIADTRPETTYEMIAQLVSHAASDLRPAAVCSAVDIGLEMARMRTGGQAG